MEVLMNVEALSDRKRRMDMDAGDVG